MMESNLSSGVTTLLCCFDPFCWGCIHQRWARIRTGSGLKNFLAGSGLDRTAIFFEYWGIKNGWDW